jgi:hypothetical protein
VDVDHLRDETLESLGPGTRKTRDIFIEYRYLKLLRQPCAGIAEQIPPRSCKPRKEDTYSA